MEVELPDEFKLSIETAITYMLRVLIIIKYMLRVLITLFMPDKLSVSPLF